MILPNKKLGSVLAVLVVTMGLWLVVSLSSHTFKWGDLFKVQELIPFLALTLFGCYLSGLQQFVLLKKQGVVIGLQDQILLPVSMALFGYIIPTNGGLLFSIYFLKKKYNVAPSDSVSIGVLFIYVSLLLTGVLGLVYAFTDSQNSVPIGLVSFCLLLVPWTIVPVVTLLMKSRLTSVPVVSRFLVLLNSVVSKAGDNLLAKDIFIWMLFLNILMILVNILSMFYLVKALDIAAPLLSIALVVMFLRLSSVVRLLPGNLGLDELFAAGAFEAFGLSASDGVVAFAYARAVSLLVLIMPLGIAHVLFNRSSLGFSGFRGFKNKLAQGESLPNHTG